MDLSCLSFSGRPRREAVRGRNHICYSTGRNRLAAMELVGLDTIDDGSLYLDPRVEAAVDAVGDNCIKRDTATLTRTPTSCPRRINR